MPAILEKWSFFCDLNSNSQVWSLALGGQTGFIAQLQQAGEDDDEVCEAWSAGGPLFRDPSLGPQTFHFLPKNRTRVKERSGGYPQILFYWEFPWLPYRHQRGLSSYLRWTKYSDMYMGRSWGDLFCTLWGYTMISCQVIAGLTERQNNNWGLLWWDDGGSAALPTKHSIQLSEVSPDCSSALSESQSEQDDELAMSWWRLAWQRQPPLCDWVNSV